MLPPDDPAPAPAPPEAPEEEPVPPPDAGLLEEPVAGDGDVLLALPGEDFSSDSLSGEDEPVEPPPPEPEPMPASRPANHRTSTKEEGSTRSPVGPAPVPDAPAEGADFSVLMKSLPVVKTAQRDGSTDEAALAGAAPDPAAGSGPIDRRWPVAASLALICGGLGAHAVMGWRRRRSRYWVL